MEKLLCGKFYLQINRLLQRRSRYGISKAKIAGSIGKHTTIVSSDVDLIVFLHLKEEHQNLDSKGLDVLLSNVIDDFEAVLRNYNIQHPIKDIATNIYSLTFTVRNIKFDLLPAIDFIGNQEDVLQQQQMTLDTMTRNLDRYVYRFSSSLAYSTVEFMKKQSSFAHDMARLAKFWYKSACIDQHISGANYFMELVAVFVVNQMTTYKHCDAFRNFLKQMTNFERINIVFADEYRQLIGHRPAENESLPRMIDPSNPYNNLGKFFAREPRVIAALKGHAQNTLQNLQQLISTAELELHHSIDLFDPFLVRGVKVFKVSPKYVERGIRRLKDVEVRSRMNFADRKKIEFIQLCFSAIVKKLDERYGPDNLELVIEALVKILTKQLKATTFIAINNYAHADFDASVWLKTEHSGAIRFSFDVEYSRIENDLTGYITKKKSKKQIYSRKTDAELKAKHTGAVCLCTYVL